MKFTVQDTQFLFGGLLASNERCTLKQGKGNLNTQKGSFVVLHQKLAWTLCNNLYYMLYICIYHGGPTCNFTNFLSCKSTNSTYIKNKCRINYLIYRIVQKYFIHLIIFLKLIVQDMQRKVRRYMVKETLEIRKAGSLLIVLHEESMTLCNKLYIPCSIFEFITAGIYEISRISSTAKALARPISKYT